MCTGISFIFGGAGIRWYEQKKVDVMIVEIAKIFEDLCLTSKSNKKRGETFSAQFHSDYCICTLLIILMNCVQFMSLFKKITSMS